MKELNIEKFSVKKAELVEMMQSMKDIKINGIDDKVGYQAAKDAKSLCVSKRGAITTAGKDMRAGALKFQKDVIAHEKSLMEIITPVEKGIKEEIQAYDEEKAIIRRKKLLPIRHERLKKIEVNATDELLLEMDSDKFEEFFNECNLNFVRTQKEASEKKEQEAREKLEKIEREAKEKEEAAQKAIDEANEKIKKLEEAERVAKEKIEQEEKAKKEAKERLDKEAAEMVAKLKLESEEREAKIKAEFEEAKLKKVKEDEEKALQIKEAAELLVKTKKWNEFLAKHGRTEDNAKDFIHSKDDSTGVIRLYKLVGEITIKK